MKNFFDSKIITDDDKKDILFQAISGLRDALNISKSKQSTYKDALDVIKDINPEYYDSFVKLLLRKNNSENLTVKLYKEIAFIQSQKTKSHFSEKELIEQEIENKRALLKSDLPIALSDSKQILKEIAKLEAALLELMPINVTEDMMLRHDYENADRKYLFGEVLVARYKYRDYDISNNRFLRMRLLHPNKAEQITGADMIYEQYNITTKKARFVFLQYKSWDNGVLYLSKNKNLATQLEKLKKTLCFCDFCEGEEKGNWFRLPHCAGFLRPTDRQQFDNNEKRIVSSGLHIPVCQATSLFAENKKLVKKDLQEEGINHLIFEQLFKHNLIGSRWIEVEKLEKFYQSKKILEPTETLKIYAKDVINY